MKIIQQAHIESEISRRSLLCGGLMGGAGLLLSGLVPQAAWATLASQQARTLGFNNLHTGERCAITYWEHGAYLPGALQEIAKVLRDHRTNQQHAIDPALLDLLTILHGKLESSQPYEVISGYRSPATNASLHAQSNGVATRSLHMDGKAIDLRVPGRELKRVHSTALAMKLGGVGYYPSSDFVHVDTGRVRQWSGV